VRLGEHRMAPLYEWRNAAQYDTAEQCEQGRQELTAEASKVLKGAAINSSAPFFALILSRPGEKTAFRSLFLYARCIASNDPELKAPLEGRSPTGHATPFPIRGN